MFAAGVVTCMFAASASAQAPALDHAKAHAACKAHEKNHDAHKNCVHTHHMAAVHPAHHHVLNAAFTACHPTKDHAAHQKCVHDHMKKHGASA